MNNEELQCWRCGASVTAIPRPIARLAECPACHAELHVCRLCRYYDRRVSQSCREVLAEEVRDKERANFCGYFDAVANAWSPPDEAAASQARDRLEALFGKAEKPCASEGTNPVPRADSVREELEALFTGKNREK